MKTILIITTILFIFFSCTKSSTQNNNNNNNGGSNNNGSGNLTVSEILPKRPYPAENITINGSGFNADKNKDTVEFGFIDNSGQFRVYDLHKFASANIISASASQLIVHAQDTFVNQLDYFNYTISSNDSHTVIRVKANGNSFVTQAIPFSRLLSIFFTQSHGDASNTNDRLKPGDSISIYGNGYNLDKCKMKVYLSGENGLCSGSCSNVPQDNPPFHNTFLPNCNCTAFDLIAGCSASGNFSVDSSSTGFGNQNCIISFRLKKDFFGHPQPDATFQYDRTVVILKIEDGEGRTVERGVGAYLYPLQ